MRDDEYPKPVSDPEAEGLPDTVDDDSTARDDVLTGREADGPDPAALPADRPLGMDLYGNTAEEQLHGESLDYKIAREQPNPPVVEPLSAPDDLALAAEADSEEAAAQAQLDADIMGPGPTSDPRSTVSIYDHGNLDGTTGQQVGRLVEPDEGARYDDEPDSIGRNVGAAGGGASAEELAVHEIPPPD
jgi:hypothetical protein